MKKRLLVLTIVFVMIIGMMVTTQGFAASISARMSGGTCTALQNVTVTLTYSGATFGAARVTLNYDSSVLEIVGYGGAITSRNGNSFLLEAEGASSLTGTFTFRTKAAGSPSVTATTTSAYNWDIEEVTCSSASTTVTVKAPATSSGGSSSSSSKKTTSGGRGNFKASNTGTPDEVEEVEEVDPSVKPEQIEIVLGGRTYIICEVLKDKELPEGFTASDMEYGEYKWGIQVAKSEDSQYTLILLTDKETGEEGWFFFDEETGAITNSTTLTVAETLEHEKLVAESKNKDTENLLKIFIAATAILGVAFIGQNGYILFKKRRRNNEFE